MNGTSQKPVPFTIPVCSVYLFDDYPGNTYLEKGLFFFSIRLPPQKHTCNFILFPLSSENIYLFTQIDSFVKPYFHFLKNMSLYTNRISAFPDISAFYPGAFAAPPRGTGPPQLPDKNRRRGRTPAPLPCFTL